MPLSDQLVTQIRGKVFKTKNFGSENRKNLTGMEKNVNPKK